MFVDRKGLEFSKLSYAGHSVGKKLKDQFFCCIIPMVNYSVKMTEFDVSCSKLSHSDTLSLFSITDLISLSLP